MPPTMPPDARRGWEFASGDEIVPGRTMRALLGGGERCQAYAAWNHRLMRPTVIKLLRPGAADDERARRRLAREGNRLAGLEHPGLPRLLAMDAAAERPFIELEHVEGPRLSTLIRRSGPLHPEQAIPLGRQLAATIGFLHAAGIVHLDVKPSNIIMGRTPRLIDLSVARRVERAPRINGFVGTDAYMAPEQADPVLWRTIGPAADVWGLGATIYHAVARRLPYARGRHDAEGVERFPQLAGPPAPLGPTSDAPGMAAIVMGCLERHPAARPPVPELVHRLGEQAAHAG